MTNIQFDDKTLSIDKNIQISFKYKISQVLYNDRLLFILLEIPNTVSMGYDEAHNVFAYNYNGDFVWQIGSRKMMDNTDYVLITLEDENNLYATDYLGRRFKVNSITGEVSEMRIVK